MRALSDDLRLRIHEACQDGDPTAEVSQRFSVSTAFVRRLKQRFRETGSIAPRPGGSGPTSKLEGRIEELRQSVLDHPDDTPQEHNLRLGLGVDCTTVWRAMRRLGLTHQEKKSVHASERDRPDVKAARDAWPEAVAGVAAEDLVFLDETGASTALHRTHGYAPRGERLAGEVPHDHWKVVTFLGALTAGGLVAPWAQAEAMTGEVFLAYIEQILVPRLRPGMVVVMDNLSCHKVGGVREALERAGCRLEYLPPYSPDFNPIEQAFSKFKRLLRTAAARTIEGVYGAMKEALGHFKPTECLNFIRHCGYPHATSICTPL